MSHDLRLERVLDGTPEEIFDAFVDPEAMREWYQDNPGWEVAVEACDVRVGGTTVVAFGAPDENWRCREEMTYRVVERPARLVYAETFATSPNGTSFDTVVTVTFEPQDGKTLLTLVQTGFPTADQRDAHQGGWPGFIDRLEKAAVSRASA